jgi:hypothetical protein
MSFCLKTIIVLDVMVAADDADRNCKDQRRMVDQVWCISRKRTSALLTPVLSPAGFFCAM